MRPNILMFGDYCFIDDRTHGQYEAFDAWLEVVHGSQRDYKDASLVIVEMGAGSAVPTVRRTSESVAASTTRVCLLVCRVVDLLAFTILVLNFDVC